MDDISETGIFCYFFQNICLAPRGIVVSVYFLKSSLRILLIFLQIVVLNLVNGTVVREIHESANPVLSLAALPNQMFVVGRQDGTCTVLSLQEAHKMIRVHLTGADCDGIRDISFNGKWIFAACRDCNVRKYDFNQISVHYK